jgi:DNA-binding GntR family transcriptional regulator
MRLKAGAGWAKLPAPEETVDGSDIEPLMRQRSLHDELVGRVRDMIIDGRLAPGSRVHEGELGRALGVSRTPLREALKFLASEGLVDLVPGRGAVVHRLTAKEVQDMLDVLVALETLAGRLACRNASAEQIAELRALHDRMMAFREAGNRLEYYKLNQAIHSAIAALSSNECLVSTHQAIQSRLKRVRFLGHEEPANWEGAASEHVEMIEALERRDEEAVAEVLARHLRQSWVRIQDVLVREEA